MVTHSLRELNPPLYAKNLWTNHLRRLFDNMPILDSRVINLTLQDVWADKSWIKAFQRGLKAKFINFESPALQALDRIREALYDPESMLSDGPYLD